MSDRGLYFVHQAAVASSLARSIIVVHGGAGRWPQRRQRDGLLGIRVAVEAGSRVLQRRGHARDAVETAIISLEDNPIFNAGVGSALNLDGDVEMDAAIMDGASLRAGAVALVRGVRNPIKLARIVMERTDHVLIAGRGAGMMASGFGVPKARLRVDERVQAWRKAQRDFKRGRAASLSMNYALYKSGVLRKMDTVGALALDARGNLAAACSTGGLSLKLPGRIGDSAIIGAGLYADNTLGAATATGIGEIAIRAAISKTACDLMKRFPAPAASELVIKTVNSRIGRGLGIITLDRQGRYGVAHSTRHLLWGVADGSNEPEAMVMGKRL